MSLRRILWDYEKVPPHILENIRSLAVQEAWHRGGKRKEALEVLEWVAGVHNRRQKEQGE